MKVLKFGGASVGTPDRIRNVTRIILDEARSEPVIVVVSAFQGVTNQLLECARLAERDDPSGDRLVDRIGKRHFAAVGDLLGRSRSAYVRAELGGLLRELRDLLHGVRLLGHCPPRAFDLAASVGERLSAPIVAAYLNRFQPARRVDARQFLITDDQLTRANVIFSKTNAATRRHFRQMFRRSRRVIPVVTGFIGATTDGRTTTTTTIGRNGSDYTASIIAAAVGASVIEIWTDVDGVLSADPNLVPAAFALSEMTYEEAMELSYFGAKVLHPASIAPVVARGVPILIKNSFNPSAPGTRVSRRSVTAQRLATGISSVSDLTLFTFRWQSVVGEPGLAERLFRALASRGINVLLVSQASSEHTICFAATSAEALSALQAIQHEFRFELQHRLTELDERPEQAMIAVVGDGMAGRPGVCGKIFGALGRHNINVRVIAQGASERNVSCVIDATQRVRALNAIHQAFFETVKRLALVIVGVGNIGEAVLRLLNLQHGHLLERGFDVTVVGLANGQRYVLEPGGISPTRWREELAASRCPMVPHTFAREIAGLELTNVAIVDCTAGSRIVDAYPAFVNADLHIITTNKQANVVPWRRYAALHELLTRRQKLFLYEANVGAGLPVMSTLRDLIDSGDVVTKVEGVLSGALSYLFNQFDGTVPFSRLIKEAQELGLTEPDPREDLSGKDVARQLLILARQCGSKMNIQSVRVESLVPRRLAKTVFSSAFFSAYSREDARMNRRVRSAAARGAVLRYVGILENGRAHAAVREFPRDHPIAATKGSDNIIAFTTERYALTPLVVQGPGAGADVTATGVFSDILKLLNYLPA
jgi:aspartokinase/homoserine dehydrogenase 1